MASSSLRGSAHAKLEMEEIEYVTRPLALYCVPLNNPVWTSAYGWNSNARCERANQLRIVSFLAKYNYEVKASRAAVGHGVCGESYA